MLKIALLFLTITDVYHEDYWLDFLRGNETRYSIYVHSKKQVSEGLFFKKYEMAIKVPTEWERPMKAQVALLREALKDPKNDKFIFLSETTIPLQDFETVYERIMITNKSIFQYWPNPHLKEGPDFDPRRILHEIPITFTIQKFPMDNFK